MGWNTPIVHMFHTLAALKEQVEGYQEDHRRLRTEREIVHCVEAIVAATPLDREHMVSYYEAPADRIAIIPPGVNLDLFHPIPKQAARLHVGTPCEPCEESHVLLYVGRMDPMKGVDDLLRALPYVVQDLPYDWSCRICLALVGGDAESSDESLRQEMTRLENLKRELGIEQFATLLGRRDQDELPYYYASADICIVPSHYESFGMVALESLACSTPVVASRVGGLTYIVEDGASGFLVPRGEPIALAHRISQLLDDCQLRRRMGLYGQETAREYAWPRIADRIVSLYELFQSPTPQLSNLPFFHQGDRILAK